MNLRVRYQVLSGEMNEAELGNVIEDAADRQLHPPRFLERRYGSRGLGPFGLLVAAAETPRKVTSREGEAELEEVKQMLLEGKIKPEDLVDLGKGWQSIRECYPFEEEVFLFDRRARKRWWIDAAVIVGVLIVSSVFAYYVVVK